MKMRKRNFAFWIWIQVVGTCLGIFCSSSVAVSLHDPHIIKQRGYYYIFSTGRRGHVIQTVRSTDLVTWQPVPDIFEKLPSWISEEIPGCRNLRVDED